MEEYLNNYTKTFNNNVLISFAKQLTRRWAEWIKL
jgi:hypothetical protein